MPVADIRGFGRPRILISERMTRRLMANTTCLGHRSRDVGQTPVWDTFPAPLQEDGRWILVWRLLKNNAVHVDHTTRSAFSTSTGGRTGTLAVSTGAARRDPADGFSATIPLTSVQLATLLLVGLVV